MTLRFATVIFDLDGTLMESAEGVLNALRYTLNVMGLPCPSSDAECRRFLGPPLRVGLHAVAGLDGAELDEAVIHYRKYYRETGLFEARCYPGIPGLLRDLRDAGAKVCLATSKYSAMAEKMLEHFGLWPLIDHAVMSRGAEVQSAKKDMLREVLAASGTTPDKAVMIGDTRYDAEGARAAETPFIGVLYGYGTREEMEKAGGKLFAADIPELKKLLFVSGKG